MDHPMVTVCRRNKRLIQNVLAFVALLFTSQLLISDTYVVKLSFRIQGISKNGTAPLGVDESNTTLKSKEDTRPNISIDSLKLFSAENAKKEPVVPDPTLREPSSETPTFATNAVSTSYNITNVPNPSLENNAVRPTYNITEAWIKKCVSNLKKESERQGPFRVSRPNYAIGDCIKMCNKCEWSGRNWRRNPSLYDGHRPKNIHFHYPNWTLAGAYGNLACPRNHSQYKLGGNISVVEQLFRRFQPIKKWTKPDPEALVLHLRLGDMVENSNDDVETMLSFGGRPWPDRGYRSIKSAQEYLDSIKESDATHVIIIGGSHKPDMYKKSRLYANCLKEALKNGSGLNVSMDLDSGDAEKDFYFMSNAKKLVVSSGGFSRLIGTLVKYKGGSVYGAEYDYSNKEKESASSRRGRTEAASQKTTKNVSAL